PFGYENDTTITVTSQEIKQYYKEHRHLYKQPASRDVEYVVFEVVPSADDIQQATIEADALHDEFIETDNVRSFLLKNSDRQLTDYYYKAGELSTISSDINNYVFNEKNPEVSPLFKKDNVFYAAKVLDTQMVPDSVYVRHILLQGDNEELADSLLTVVKKKGSNFAALAFQYSADQNTNVPERGDIGWMTQTYMIPGMESVMTAKLNEPFILETSYGRHIVEVTQRTTPIEKKKVAILERAIIPSKATYNDFYSKANALAVAADGKYENYKAAVAEQGLLSHPVNNMLESSSSLGTIKNTKEVTRWVFDAKAGKASSIITVNNDYFFIVAVKNIHKKGYATIEETAPTIKTILTAKKQGEKKTQYVNETIAGLGSMQAIAEALNTTVSTQDNVTFASLTSQSLDPKFIGAVSVTEPGVISGPVTGSVGVYVYRVTAHDTGAFFTEDDAKTAAARDAQYNSQVLMNVMTDDAGVVDNRARFY
ncbi:MAG: peptidyl-prolyl cis-trans isomerase, partial [Porphyromonadaceae bacterium]|nr:peptidyl-prolyl cis-trans isomerase [Porphyromonadaceae bacterium]